MTRIDLAAEEIPERQLRNAFGRFATGVTVISACLPDGRAVGLTVNSFASLSLDPPLVLWNLRSGSPSEPAFARGRAFCVNVLRATQQELSQHFCRPAEDKFAGIETEPGLDGCPILAGALAAFECRVDEVVTSGDHRIVIGRVLHARYDDGDPLIYHSGRYRTAADLALGQPA